MDVDLEILDNVLIAVQGPQTAQVKYSSTDLYSFSNEP